MSVTATNLAGLPGFTARAAQPRAVLLIVHGLAEHADRYRSHALELAQLGICCFAYDQRGHGAAPGPRTHIERFQQLTDDLARVVTGLRTQEPSLPLFVWGHSMGSIVLAEAASSLSIRGAILSSCSLEAFRDRQNPLRPVFQFVDRVLPRVRVPLRLDASKISSEPSVQRAYASDPLIPATASLRLVVEFARACQRLRISAAQIQLPCLLLHGELDAIAPADGSRQLFAALGGTDKQLQIFAEQRHEVHNESPLMRARFLATLAEWILQRAS